jgi:hypothetical protein
MSTPTTRYLCPLECGWHYDTTGPSPADAPGPYSPTQDETAHDMAARMATDAGRAHAARVESALADHLSTHAMLQAVEVLAEQRKENARLRKVIAHLMTNPLDQREATYWTDDIDSQTGAVEIADGTDHAGHPVTTIRITDRTE